jgi:lipopolysaccharide export system permease protein
MDKLSKYIIKELNTLFFTLFSVITVIVSLIFIISISNITKGLQITFLELIKMYLLSLPQIIFISLSISFFITTNILYSKLSETQELVALFSLGFSPLRVLKPIIILSIIITTINLFILFVSIPYSKIAFLNLKSEKKQEAKFNFQSAQISQQFGNWSIFVKENKNNEYSDIFLYNKESKRFIIANNASLKNQKGYLIFSLNNGNIYDFNSSFKINFNSLKINQKIPKIKISIFNLKNYFSYNKYLFTKYLPFALIPIALLFFIPQISFFHPRLHKNKTLIYSIMLLSIYITLTFINKNFTISLILPTLFFIIGGILYKWKVRF